MKNIQKFGGFAAIYLGAAYLIGMVLYLIVLDYPSITNPSQKLSLLIEMKLVIFSTNLLLYVFFGVVLIVLALALYDRLRTGAPGKMQFATVLGMIWAGSLIASGMVANAGIDPVVSLSAKDPAQAALMWQGIEIVSSGLGNGNGEILGGLWTLLVSLAGLSTARLSKTLSILGLMVGGVGTITLYPALADFTGIFGLGQTIWFVWLGVVLLRKQSV